MGMLVVLSACAAGPSAVLDDEDGAAAAGGDGRAAVPLAPGVVLQPAGGDRPSPNEDVFNAGPPPANSKAGNYHVGPPPLAAVGMKGVVNAGPPGVLPQVNAVGPAGGAGCPPDGRPSYVGAEDEDGSDFDDGSESVEEDEDVADSVVDARAPAETQRALMRILFAWLSAVDSRTHIALRQALTAHVWENREWVLSRTSQEPSLPLPSKIRHQALAAIGIGERAAC